MDEMADLFGETAITKCGLSRLSPISFAGVEYGQCGMGGWSAVGYEGSLSRFGSGFSSHMDGFFVWCFPWTP